MSGQRDKNNLRYKLALHNTAKIGENCSPESLEAQLAGLSDMEELLNKIKNKDFVDYMREAISCYNGGAYRGCIVMSYIALFDDLRAKLSELTKVNGDAKKIWVEVEKRAASQEVFESYMADQLKAKGLLEESKYQRLNLVRDLRNKAAHPSGFHASAEEARFVFKTVIDEFLSESLLKTTHAVDALIGDLEKTNYFPSAKVDDIAGIVKDDLAKLHDKAFPYLVTKLLEVIDASSTASDNAEKFLIGIASLRLEGNRKLLREKVISACCVDKKNAAMLGRIISADAALLDGLAAKDHGRVRKLLVDYTKTSVVGLTSKLAHPAKQMGSMLETLKEEYIIDNYDELFSEILKRYPYEPVFFKALDGKDILRERLVANWKKNAGSSTFDVANKFAKSIQEIDLAFETLLTDEDAFEVAVRVKQAADWGAFDAKSVISGKFSDAPNLAKAATKYIADHKSDAEDFVVAKSVADSIEEFIAAVF